jgi:hypothetical protein
MKSKQFFFVLFCFLNPIHNYLVAQNYAIALKLSSLGITCEGIRSFGTTFNARIGFSMFTYQYHSGESEKDWRYDADLSLLSLSALIDWYPFQSIIHLTGGAIINLNESDITIYPIKTYRIGGTIYTPELLGNVSANVQVNKVAPYMGVGLGRPAAANNFSFSIDLGVIYQGAPKVDMTAKGLLEPSAEQGPLIEDNLNWFKFYPVISLGIAYKF